MNYGTQQPISQEEHSSSDEQIIEDENKKED